MIKSINSSSVCANIRPPTNTMVFWAPFRSNNITNGNVFLWKQTIYVSLVTDAPSSSQLPWAILSSVSDCVIAPGNIYNPNEVDGDCSTENPAECAVGNLTGRIGPLEVKNGAVEVVVTDPGLEQAGGERLMLAVGEEGDTRCAIIQAFPNLTVVASAGEGRVMLTQPSPLDWTQVTLNGPQDFEFEIHSTADCESTGGIFDPRGAEPDPPMGSTLDFYPFGNLTGKAGGQVMNYADPYLPLTGGDSVVGRALVVRRTDGSISGCGLLHYDDDIIQMRAVLEMEGFAGTVVFSQPANNPLSETIITVETNISAEVEVFTPISSLPEATPTTTPPLATTSILASVTPSPATSRTELSSSLSPSLLMPYESSSVVLATFLPSPAPMPSSSVFLLMPDTTDTFTPDSTVTPGQQGRRRRKREVGEYNWSLRQWDGSVSDVPQNCNDLPLVER